MRLSSVAPGPALAPFVRAFTVVETRDAASRVLLPETGLVLGVRYGGSARQEDDGGRGDPAGGHPVPDLVLTGMRDRTRRMSTSAGGRILLATFHPGGAAAFLAEPLHELFGRSVALDALVPARDVGRLAGDVAGAPDEAGRVAALERFLLGRLRARPDPLAVAAAHAIRRAHGNVGVTVLARALGVSRDRLEKRFRRGVGTSPKRFAAVVRVLRAVALHRAAGASPGASAGTLSRAAAAAGYADQSHFVRAFRAVAGEAPGRFLRSADYC